MLLIVASDENGTSPPGIQPQLLNQFQSALTQAGHLALHQAVASSQPSCAEQQAQRKR
jgi:hypothetical protein